MNGDILLERDMLYPTGNSNEPGSIHIQVYPPDTNARIPVLLESKSGHSPIENIDTIVRIMQSDIFDRIFIDVRKNVDIYIRKIDEPSQDIGAHSHILVRLTVDGIKCEGVDL